MAEYDYSAMDETADDYSEGWQAIQAWLSEDEAWAASQHELFHGREY